MKEYTIGIDVGGTFTDFLVMNSENDEQLIDKISTTPQDPSIGVLNGLESLASMLSTDTASLLAQTRLIVHGTTVTTNAVLTGRGARTGLITTEGFRDVLQMRRGVRSREHLYNNKYVAPPPLVSRDLVTGVGERTDLNGSVLKEVSREDLEAAAAHFREEGVSSVAICFMHAYANPHNEQRAKKIMQELMPEAFISISTDVSPIVRLYNRVSTVTMNAYVGPVLKNYIDLLVNKLQEAGFTNGELLIMQSNGGVTNPANVARIPASTVLSGPAGGPVSGSAFAASCGHQDAIVVDMGGTSFEASIIQDGQVTIKKEGEINRNLISLPMAAIHTIGSGGGSIAWIDQGGLLQVGPQSASAVPGPACYGRGGELPTCSDADLVLGYLNPEFFLGGGMGLDHDKAVKAIQTHIAEPLGMTVEEAAYGIYQISNLNMANGVKEVTVQSGYDPRDFPLVVAGGAGPVHAAMIARELQMKEIIIPKFSSVLCAVGMLASNLRHDYVKSYNKTWSETDFNEIMTILVDDRKEGMHALEMEGVPEHDREVLVGLDMRYSGQHYEVTIEIPESLLVSGGKDIAEEAFHKEHDRLYGFDMRGHEMEILNVRLSCRGDRAQFSPLSVQPLEPGEKVLPKNSRPAYDPMQRKMVETDVYDGETMKAGASIEGPAIIELTTTTIVVPTGFQVSLGQHGNFVMQQQNLTYAFVEGGTAHGSDTGIGHR